MPFCVTSGAKNAGTIAANLEAVLTVVISLLAEDTPLPERNRDHALGGDWRDHRECHLKPDLLLIYRKPDTEVLQFVRPGLHSELFG